jgi:hypothetical protein
MGESGGRFTFCFLVNIDIGGRITLESINGEIFITDSEIIIESELPETIKNLVIEDKIKEVIFKKFDKMS